MACLILCQPALTEERWVGHKRETGINSFMKPDFSITKVFRAINGKYGFYQRDKITDSLNCPESWAPNLIGKHRNRNKLSGAGHWWELRERWLWGTRSVTSQWSFCGLISFRVIGQLSWSPYSVRNAAHTEARLDQTPHWDRIGVSTMKWFRYKIYWQSKLHLCLQIFSRPPKPVFELRLDVCALVTGDMIEM